LNINHATRKKIVGQASVALLVKGVKKGFNTKNATNLQNCT